MRPLQKSEAGVPTRHRAYVGGGASDLWLVSIAVTVCLGAIVLVVLRGGGPSANSAPSQNPPTEAPTEVKTGQKPALVETPRQEPRLPASPPQQATQGIKWLKANDWLRNETGERRGPYEVQRAFDCFASRSDFEEMSEFMAGMKRAEIPQEQVAAQYEKLRMQWLTDLRMTTLLKGDRISAPTEEIVLGPVRFMVLGGGIDGTQWWIGAAIFKGVR